MGGFDRARGESKMVRSAHSPSCCGCKMQTDSEMTVKDCMLHDFRKVCY